MVNLTEQELTELKQKFSSVVINESIDYADTKIQLSNGKYITGYVTESGVFTVKTVSTFLCG